MKTDHTWERFFDLGPNWQEEDKKRAQKRQQIVREFKAKQTKLKKQRAKKKLEQDALSDLCPITVIRKV